MNKSDIVKYINSISVVRKLLRASFIHKSMQIKFLVMEFLEYATYACYLPLHQVMAEKEFLKFLSNIVL